jgi:hypothetical protein
LNIEHWTWNGIIPIFTIKNFSDYLIEWKEPYFIVLPPF